MSVIDTAVNYMIQIANDSSHGYDQANRWGPNYDCSSLVITAYQKAGTGVKDAGATYTGNMYNAFLKQGFKDVTSSVNLATGKGLKKGDVLLNKSHHTAMMIDATRLAQASINEKGGITGGKTGDQTGGEINIRSYYNYPWNCILRYGAQASESTTVTTDVYIVQTDDSLWLLAEKLLGNGNLYPQIMAANNLTTTWIYPGMKLKIPRLGAQEETKEETTMAKTCTATLPVLKSGETGMSVRALQTLLKLRGVSLPSFGVDGDFGAETDSAVRKYQAAARLTVDGIVGAKTWEALLG